MAAIYQYGFDCGYTARVKGQNANEDSVDRYVNIFIKPEAEKMHKSNCTRCN